MLVNTFNEISLWQLECRPSPVCEQWGIFLQTYKAFLDTSDCSSCDQASSVSQHDGVSSSSYLTGAVCFGAGRNKPWVLPVLSGCARQSVYCGPLPPSCVSLPGMHMYTCLNIRHNLPKSKLRYIYLLYHMHTPILIMYYICIYPPTPTHLWSTCEHIQCI